MKLKSCGTVLIIAIALRLLAVIFSQGYMASDDHHETVKMAWKWHAEGRFFNDQCELIWGDKAGHDIMRSPLYNFLIWLGLKIGSLLGLTYMDQMMYLQRLGHALLSLLAVVFAYRYLKDETDENTALLGSLIVATHFIMPFISVRHLGEMVAADLLMPAFYFAHVGFKKGTGKNLILSGLLCGLAIMFRPHAILAIAPIGLILLFYKHYKLLWKFVVAFGIMLLFSAMLDMLLVGKFMVTTIKYFSSNMGNPNFTPGPWYQYILLMLGLFIPPFSLVFLGSIVQKEVIKKHIILFSGFAFFFIGHSIYQSKQERFMIPLLPIVIVLSVLGLYYLYHKKSWYFRLSFLRKAMWIYAAVINLILLTAFTFNYSHKGRIDPLVYISRQDDAEFVLFDATERDVLIPYGYLGPDPPRYERIRSYSEINQLTIYDSCYIVVFTDLYLEDHIDSLKSYFVHIEQKSHSAPSLIDYILNKLNPKYNHTNEAYVLKGYGFHKESD